jgi:single-stranded-DNA-specific exonuclease
VRQGLQLLPKSKLAGVQALIQVTGLSGAKQMKPEAIGFRLGPRINAVGRLADPQIVIELLTTDDEGVALERAMQCEQINKQRQQLCEQIEQEAIAIVEAAISQTANGLDSPFAPPTKGRVLVVVQPGWHHGVIGIVASRLVERYGVPVFIGTYEDDEQTHIRGSARSIPEFNVFDALQFCSDLLGRFGGHRAAGGFSLEASNLEPCESRLQTFAHQCLQPEHLKPLVVIDTQATVEQLDLSLYAQIDALHPCGIENPDPVFWSANVRICEQKRIGKGHIKLVVSQDDAMTGTRKFTGDRVALG